MTLASMKDELFRGARQRSLQQPLPQSDIEQDHKLKEIIDNTRRYNERIETATFDKKGEYELAKHNIRIQRTQECQVRAIVFVFGLAAIAMWVIRFYGIPKDDR